MALILVVLGSAPPPDASCTVRSVTDGDTIACEDGRKVRLSGIDAPELGRQGKPGQPWSAKAAGRVRELAHGKTVTLRVLGTDRYGRTIARVLLDAGGDLGELLVREGLAWHYRRYCPVSTPGTEGAGPERPGSSGTTEDPAYCDGIEAAELAARAVPLGLWSGTGTLSPVPPWEWRHSSSH